MMVNTDLPTRDVRPVSKEKPTGNVIVLGAMAAMVLALHTYQHKFSDEERNMIQRAARACGSDVDLV